MQEVFHFEHFRVLFVEQSAGRSAGLNGSKIEPGVMDKAAAWRAWKPSKQCAAPSCRMNGSRVFNTCSVA